MNYNLNQCFRVVFESRENYRLMNDSGNIYPAQLTGNFRERSEVFPAVGDYLNGRLQQGDWVVIDEVLPRKSVLQREAAGHIRPQVLVANVDVLFIVTSANDDFNLKRLDRYIAMAVSGGVTPVILINKIELGDAKNYLDATAVRYLNIAVHGVSVHENINLESLNQYALQQNTLAFVGSSGVGKSSLTNYLLGKKVMLTSEIRESDDRGKHTTTHRELHVTESGVVVIDTPGLRSVGLSENTELDSLFGNIHQLINQCKFSDCKHQTEPNCAVLSALDNNDITEDHWINYLKLQKEVLFAQRKSNKAEASAQKKKWAKHSYEIRENHQQKRRKAF